MRASSVSSSATASGRFEAVASPRLLKYATRSRLTSSLTYWASGWSESARTCIRMIEGVSRIDAAKPGAAATAAPAAVQSMRVTRTTGRGLLFIGKTPSTHTRPSAGDLDGHETSKLLQGRFLQPGDLGLGDAYFLGYFHLGATVEETHHENQSFPLG